MKHEPGCFYCAKSQALYDLMIEIAPLEVSTVYLFKEQTHRGRIVVAHREHTKELFDLPPQEYEAYMRDVARAARAVQRAVSPDKLNYGAYADKNPHLHFHIVPKTKDGPEWGTTFEMMPAQKVLLQEADYQELVQSIRTYL
jgi:ATP adenylyltransferase